MRVGGQRSVSDIPLLPTALPAQSRSSPAVAPRIAAAATAAVGNVGLVMHTHSGLDVLLDNGPVVGRLLCLKVSLDGAGVSRAVVAAEVERGANGHGGHVAVRRKLRSAFALLPRQEFRFGAQALRPRPWRRTNIQNATRKLHSQLLPAVDALEDHDDLVHLCSEAMRRRFRQRSARSSSSHEPPLREQLAAFNSPGTTTTNPSSPLAVGPNSCTTVQGSAVESGNDLARAAAVKVC